MNSVCVYVSVYICMRVCVCLFIVIIIANVWGAVWSGSVTETRFLADTCPGGLVLVFINITARLLMEVLNENRTQLLKFNFLCKIKEVARDWNTGWAWGCLGSSHGLYITLCGFHFLGAIFWCRNVFSFTKLDKTTQKWINNWFYFHEWKYLKELKNMKEILQKTV